MEKFDNSAIVRMNQKLSLLPCLRSATVRSLEFLFNHIRTSVAQPTIVHLHQMLHTLHSVGRIPRPSYAVRSARSDAVWAQMNHCFRREGALDRPPLGAKMQSLSSLIVNAKEKLAVGYGTNAPFFARFLSPSFCGMSITDRPQCRPLTYSESRMRQS